MENPSALTVPNPLQISNLRYSRVQLCATARQRAYTRIDLLVVIGVLVLLSSWFAWGGLGSFARRVQCASHLGILGQATHHFADSHADALPPASIDPPRIAWDAQIAPFLPPKRATYGWGQLLRCPSDNIDRASPRSYSMPAYNMQLQCWPPVTDIATGVGLVWNRDTIQRLLGENAWKMAATNTDFLAMIKRASIPSPSGTTILTEQMNRANILKDIRMATIGGLGQHLELLINARTNTHNGRLHYLMLDGHVERLAPLHSGRLWNIGKPD